MGKAWVGVTRTLGLKGPCEAVGISSVDCARCRASPYTIIYHTLALYSITMSTAPTSQDDFVLYSAPLPAGATVTNGFIVSRSSVIDKQLGY
jgi:hypothetical protein